MKYVEMLAIVLVLTAVMWLGAMAGKNYDEKLINRLEPPTNQE